MNERAGAEEGTPGSPEGEGGRGYTGPVANMRPNSDMAHNHTPLSRIDRGALACYGAL